MQSRRLLLALVVLSLSAEGQKFGAAIGVKGGFPFTDLLKATGTLNGPVTALNQSDNYLVGPAGEITLPFGFGFEVNGLYRGTRYQLVSQDNAPTVIHSASWEIPYLAKFHFPIPLLRPFVSAGGAYRFFTDLPSDVSVSHNAFVAGAGLELKVKRLRLSGEARYLRWGDTPENAALRLSRNQGEVLFGIMF